MRPLEETRKWDRLYSDDHIGVDLRQAVRDPESFHPCEDGLRSVSWKAFLLYGPLSQASWPKKLSESRSAYSSLRDHFLKYIDHPDDLQSGVDPLADDDNSPWSTLRQDEAIREEIFQDIERCMQDNYFFREPSTQKQMLDILFIYSKLNPDTGYRQGMHELLAPILWVIEQDAIEKPSVREDESTRAESYQLMETALDHKYVEHDTFSLFCAVMQTGKIFYETGDNKDSSPIIARSRKIQEELLATVDPELAHHLQVIGILPQVYLIRWIRLLFGREFEFGDVLRIWDVLFSQNVNLALIDMTCVTMLLSIRWSLIDADYSTGLTLLLRYSLPVSEVKPVGLIKDALYLEQNQSVEAGATVIKRFSGKIPKSMARQPQSAPILHSGISTPPKRPRSVIQGRESSSPSGSPARFLPQQKNLEALFQDVSGGIQRRTEGWSLSKAVIGAVGEVRRNVNSLQSSSPSPRASIDGVPTIYPSYRNVDDETHSLSKRLQELENRNKALARMLDSALKSLRVCKPLASDVVAPNEDTFNISLAKIQFVSVYLGDSGIPIPGEELLVADPTDKERIALPVHVREKTEEIESARDDVTAPKGTFQSPDVQAVEAAKMKPHVVRNQPTNTTDRGLGIQKSLRPSLAESSFSFMLGENRHRSSFVSSVSDLPEQRRDSESKGRPKQIWADGRDKPDAKGSESEDDGFTMNRLHGSQRR